MKEYLLYKNIPGFNKNTTLFYCETTELLPLS